MNNIEKYFAGEKLQCAIGAIVALFCIGLSVYFLTLNKQVFKGIAYTFIPLSVLLLIICIGVIIRTSKDLSRVTNFYNSASQKMITDEIPRMEKVVSNFKLIKKIEIGFLIAGILIALLFRKHDILKGIAIALMIQGIALYLFDFTAEYRAKSYFEFIKNVANGGTND